MTDKAYPTLPPSKTDASGPVRYPYTHHGPTVHGSKLEDYLISEANLREDRPDLFDDDGAVPQTLTQNDG